MLTFLLILIAIFLGIISYDLHVLRAALGSRSTPDIPTTQDITEAVEEALYNHFVERRFTEREDFQEEVKRIIENQKKPEDSTAPPPAAGSGL
ncbi:MAG TPA: hypothetical protein VKS20_14960 [Candidatus Acidoferrales bacterium]|nr:hypothetical protein [Candidatus Acidoferrales bacterium]